MMRAVSIFSQLPASQDCLGVVSVKPSISQQIVRRVLLPSSCSTLDSEYFEQSIWNCANSRTAIASNSTPVKPVVLLMMSLNSRLPAVYRAPCGRQVFRSVEPP